MPESVPQSTDGPADGPASPADSALDGWSTAPRRAPFPTAFADRLAPLTRTRITAWQALVGALVVAAVVGASFWLFRAPPPPVEQTLPRADRTGSNGSSGPGGDAGAAPSSATSPATAALVVHAAGAVGRPGVYRLRSGARVDDLIVAAGGLGLAADGNRLNLAAPLADGERVYVPRVGELAVPEPVGRLGGTGPSGGADGAGGVGGPTGAGAGPVNVNTATAEQLDTLPGIGPATAAAILDYRRQHGRFRSVDELLEVRGIGDAKLAELRPKVGV